MKKQYIIAGIIALGAVAFFMYSKNKKNTTSSTNSTNTTSTSTDMSNSSTNSTNTPSTSTDTSNETGISDNQIVTLAKGTDPTNAVFLVLGGKKYAFVSENALLNYGYKVPTVITLDQLNSLNSGGFVDKDGKVVKTA